MNVYELAREYYPRLWDLNRLKILLNAGKLTKEEYKTILAEKKEE